MRTLDNKFLMENPLGDEQSSVTLSIPIPESLEIPANADGSRPSVTLKATGDKHVYVLTALAALHEDEKLITMADLMANEQFAAVHGRQPENSEELGDMAEKIFTPYPVHEMTMNLELDGVDHEVDLHITAPSIEIAVVALKKMTDSRSLMHVAIGLSPETVDEDAQNSNEVLVRR